MFHFAIGKLPADCLVAYLPFSLKKVLRKIYSIDKFGFISTYSKKESSSIPPRLSGEGRGEVSTICGIKKGGHSPPSIKI